MKNPAILALPLLSLAVLLAMPVRADDDDMMGGNILDRLGNDSKSVHQIWAAESTPGPEADPEKLLAKLNGHLVESEILLTPESQMWVKGTEDKVRAAREAWRLRKAGSESAEIYARNLERLAKQLDSLLQVAVEGGQERASAPFDAQLPAKADPLKASPPAGAEKIVAQLVEAPPAARLFDGAAAKSADVVAPPAPKLLVAAPVLRPLPPPAAPVVVSAPAPASAFVPLAIESDGPRVEELQRRLNDWRRAHRLRPIGADGMYGPVTRAAVWRFQRTRGLSATGVVDERTWGELFRRAVPSDEGPVSR